MIIELIQKLSSTSVQGKPEVSQSTQCEWSVPCSGHTAILTISPPLLGIFHFSDVLWDSNSISIFSITRLPTEYDENSKYL